MSGCWPDVVCGPQVEKRWYKALSYTSTSIYIIIIIIIMTQCLIKDQRNFTFYLYLKSIQKYLVFRVQADWILIHTSHKDTEQNTTEASLTLDGITLTDSLISWSPNEWPSVCWEVTQYLPIRCSGRLISLHNEHTILYILFNTWLTLTLLPWKLNWLLLSSPLLVADNHKYGARPTICSNSE
jgi:hypothetical protein